MIAVIILIVVALVVGVIFYIISTQRSLVQLEELCKNALSQIGVQLTSRWDLVQALVKMVETLSTLVGTTAWRLPTTYRNRSQPSVP